MCNNAGGRGGGERTLFFTHLFLAQLAHGARSLCVAPSGTGSMRSTTRPLPRRRGLLALALETKGGGEGGTVPRRVLARRHSWPRYVNVRDLDSHSTSVLRLDVDVVVSRRVTASPLACVVDSSKQLSNQRVDTRSLVPSVLHSFALVSAAPPPSRSARPSRSRSFLLLSRDRIGGSNLSPF